VVVWMGDGDGGERPDARERGRRSATSKFGECSGSTAKR